MPVTGDQVNQAGKYLKEGNFTTLADLSKAQQDYESLLSTLNAQNQHNPEYVQGFINDAGQIRDASQAKRNALQAIENKKNSEADALRVQGEQAAKQKALEDQTTQQRTDLESKFNQIYPQLDQSLTDQIRNQFIPARQKLVSEEKALGRLDSPASIVPLSNLDAQEQNAVAQGRGQLAGQRATGEFNITNAIQGILQNQRNAGQDAQQFGQALDFKKQGLASQVQQFYDKLRQDKELGVNDNILKGKQIDAYSDASKRQELSQMIPKVGFNFGKTF